MLWDKNTKNDEKRIVWMDIFRGWGIMLMIMGHVEFGNRFDFFIHAFHMPMFFFVSGYFFKTENISTINYIKKKAKNLLIPYAVFGLLGYAVWLHYNEKSITPLQHLLWNNTDGLANAGALWFLTALFLTEVIYFVIDKYVKNTAEKNLLILSIAIFGTITTSILPIRMPWGLDAAAVGVGLFHIGKIMHSNQNKNKLIDSLFHLNPFVWLVLAFLCCIFIFNNSYVNMRTGSYGKLPWFWFNAILAIVIGINFSKFCEKIGGGNKANYENW